MTVAIKAVLLKRLNMHLFENLEQEIVLMKSLSHTNIAKLYDVQVGILMNIQLMD